MKRDEALRLVAMVLAWQDGAQALEVEDAPKDVSWMDTAHQCLEDLQDWDLWEPR
jgi:hypothetical protein